MNLTQFARRGYVQTPTPIEKLENFSKAIGEDIHIYIKRDDLLPGCAGGNKTRKLDFSIAEALSQNADTIITCGALQSNHCRLTLSWAVKEGLDCHLILDERIKGSYTPHASGNFFLYQLLGATSINVFPGGTDKAVEMEKLAEKLRQQGKNPYIIPGGASNPVGALGYVACAQELTEQLFSMQTNIQAIIMPTGSAGTQAGLLCGLYGTNTNIPVHGINVGKSTAVQTKLVRDLSDQLCDKLNLPHKLPDNHIHCNENYIGEGYSVPTKEMIEAVKLLASTEGILVDPVYSGKALAGCIDLIRKGTFPKGSNILFLHTGGYPALYAYRDIFI